MSSRSFLPPSPRPQRRVALASFYRNPPGKGVRLKYTVARSKYRRIREEKRRKEKKEIRGERSRRYKVFILRNRPAGIDFQSIPESDPFQQRSIHMYVYPRRLMRYCANFRHVELQSPSPSSKLTHTLPSSFFPSSFQLPISLLVLSKLLAPLQTSSNFYLFSLSLCFFRCSSVSLFRLSVSFSRFRSSSFEKIHRIRVRDPRHENSQAIGSTLPRICHIEDGMCAVTVHGIVCFPLSFASLSHLVEEINYTNQVTTDPLRELRLSTDTFKESMHLLSRVLLPVTSSHGCRFFGLVSFTPFANS